MKKIIFSLALLIQSTMSGTAQYLQDLVKQSGKTPEKTFEEYVLNSKTPVVVDFFASWCPACRAIDPIYTKIASLAAFESKVTFIKVDYDLFKKDVAKSIQSLPTLAFYKNGKKVHSISGKFTEAKLTSAIESYLS